MSSRVRLARNLASGAFPGWAKKPERVQILEAIRPAVESLPEMKGAFAEAMDNLTSLDKQILVERHLISREHAAKSAGSGLVVNHDESLCVMINEEDHLRMQALRPGLQIKEAWAAIDRVDTELEEKLNVAFDNNLGYLTACPTNLGTGIRVSAMLHLPGLVLGEQINPIIQSVNKLGLAVRGLYGEGTQASGNFFQFSNQITLGQPEEEIISNLEGVIRQVITHEREAREYLRKKRKAKMDDQIWRALAALKAARVMSSSEAIQLLSLVQVGIDVGVLEGQVNHDDLNQLFLLIQPAHLQKMNGKELGATERDARRATRIREYFSKVVL